MTPPNFLSSSAVACDKTYTNQFYNLGNRNIGISKKYMTWYYVVLKYCNNYISEIKEEQGLEGSNTL